MSRHFNYELDERRIKILLNENRMRFNEDVWNEFVEKTKPIEKANKLPSIKLNFAINKSVLLTSVFVILIGSFTFIVARFIDFSSTRSNTETLREVKPDPDNFKLGKLATALPEKETGKPTEIITQQAVVQTSVPAITTTTQPLASVPVNTYVPANTTPTFVSSGDQSGMARTRPDTIKNDKDSTIVTQSPNNQQRFNNKKKKKEVEVMETKPLTTGLPGTKPEEQEEPELKLD